MRRSSVLSFGMKKEIRRTDAGCQYTLHHGVYDVFYDKNLQTWRFSSYTCNLGMASTKRLKVAST